MNEPRVSDERLAEIIPDTAGPCQLIGISEAHSIAADLRDTRARLAAAEAQVAELRDELIKAATELRVTANVLHKREGYTKLESDLRQAETRACRALGTGRW